MKAKARLKIRIVCLILTLLTFVSAIILCVGFALQKNGGYAFPAFNFKTSNVSKKNNDVNVKLDGILDEKIWSKQKRLDLAMKGNGSVSTSMTSAFDKNGIYLAFDVNDIGVYYSKSRDSFLNSGIELYVSSKAGAYNLESGDAYEIDLNVNGIATVKKYINGGYTLWPLQVDMAVSIKGELNSAECTGYVIEAFLPFSMFGDDCDFIYANPAIIRTFSAGDDQRQWYNYGIENRQVEWEKAMHWWQFDKNGLIAYDVIFNIGTNGNINGSEYVVSGDNYTFEIVPEEGYYASCVKVNKKDVSENLIYKNGQTTYTAQNVNENLSIDVEFKKIPSETFVLKGKITDKEGKSSGIVSAFIKGGYTLPIPLNDDGTFSITAPELSGARIVATNDGYITEYKSVNYSESVNITMKKEFMGINTDVKTAVAYQPENWSYDEHYKNRIQSTSKSVRNITMNSEIFSDKVYLSSNITLPLEKGVDKRAGYSFIDEEGHDVFVCLLMSYETSDYSYRIQVVTDGGESWSNSGWLEDINSLTSVVSKANSEDGVPFSVFYEQGKFTIWVDGSIAGQNVTAVRTDGSNILDKKTKVAVGLQTWYNTASFSNLVFSNSLPSNTTYMPKQIVMEESGQFRIAAPNIEQERYVVLSTHVKALGKRKEGQARTAGLGIAAKGQNRDDIYGFHMAYDHPAYKYFVSLNNGNSVGNDASKWYDIHSDNHATGEETNQLFTEKGVNVKLVRIDRTVYLLAEYNGVWQQIGFLALPENQKTELSFFNLGLKSLYTDIKIDVGKEVALESMTNLTVKPNSEFFMFQYMVNDKNWTVDMRIKDNKPSLDETLNMRLVAQVSSIIGAPKVDARQNLRFFKQGDNYHTYHSSESPWTGHKGIQVPDKYIKALQKNGLYVRYVRNGKDMHIMLSEDGKYYSFQQSIYDVLGNKDGLIRLELNENYLYDYFSIGAGEKAAMVALS